MGEFQKKGKEVNKLDYASTIYRARQIIISHDPQWVTMTKERIKAEYNQRNEEAMQTICERLIDASLSLFSSICIRNKTRQAYSIGHDINKRSQEEIGIVQPSTAFTFNLE